MTAPSLNPEELAGLLDRDGYSGLDGRPLPAVLDTSCVRTGLHYQLANGGPPASVTTGQDGVVRLFMEYDTLVETNARLPRFAKQFKAPESELRRVLNEDWLPYIEVVKLPPSLRELDRRALAVREKDTDDYPVAALAALLSPCILLTRNHTDFTALGVRTESQGVDAVMAVLGVKVGQVHLNAVVMVPALPVRLIGGTAKWVSEKIGPAAWVVLVVIVVGGIWLYFRQPLERRERIKEVGGKVGTFLLDEYMDAATEVGKARVELHACLVPKPDERSRMSAVLRELAMSPDSLSAQQLADLISPALRPRVAELREYMRANDTLFNQVRRGGFVLGRHYTLRGP